MNGVLREQLATLAVTHYSTLTGSTNVLVDAVPALLIVAAVAGVVVALRLRRREPAVIAGWQRLILRFSRMRSSGLW